MVGKGCKDLISTSSMTSSSITSSSTGRAMRIDGGEKGGDMMSMMTENEG